MSKTTSRFALALLMGLAFACGGGGGGKPGDKPTGDKPTGDKPTGDKPTGDKPTGDKPTGDKPAGDCPVGDPLCDPRFKVAGKTFDLPAGELKDIIQFKTEAYKPDGVETVVAFPHKAHATERLKAVVEKCAGFPDVAACTTCHHMDLEKDKPRKCSECHKAEEDKKTKAPKMEDALHTRCVGCHKSVNDKCKDQKFNVATDCKQCHKAPAGDKGVAKDPSDPSAPPAPAPK